MRRRVLWIILVVCLANVLAAFIVLPYVGGDALKGAVIDGHYYLKRSAQLVEVDRSVYLFAYLHELSALFSLVVIGGVGTILKWN